MKSQFAQGVILLLMLPWMMLACKPAIPEASGVTGKNGMVVSAHPEASGIGIEILKMGGNAMDAAVAVEFALSVCYPVAGNIGGGGFWVVMDAEGGFHALDYREKAPGRANRDMYLDDERQVIEGASLNTPLASGVPGTVDGMVKAHARFGALDWHQVVQPSVDLAEKGFPLTRQQAASLNSIRKDLLERNLWSTAFVIEQQWEEGDTIRQHELALTLSRIRDFGRDGFYSGVTANMIVQQMEQTGGLITRADLDQYQAVWRVPVEGTYRDYGFVSMPPPSSGGIALKQLLHMMEKFTVADSGFNSPATVHYMAEAEKRVYADRSAYLGDPDFYKVPVSELTDPKYLDTRSSEISMERATPSEQIRPGAFDVFESTETTHYSVTDRWGNAVSATTTLNGGYGSKIVVGGAGFFLNNEMDDFSIKPGVPNMYGLIGGEANAIEPGKRMLSSMTPTIVTKDGKLFMVVGSPGGSTIITSVFQTILNVIDHGMGMQEAVSAGRFHHQWMPDYIRMEPGTLDSLTIENLSKRGHQIRIQGTIGRVDAILVRSDGLFEGGADPRGDDSAKGY